MTDRDTMVNIATDVSMYPLNKQTPTIHLRPLGGSMLNKAAAKAIETPRRVEIFVSPNGFVRIIPANDDSSKARGSYALTSGSTFTSTPLIRFIQELGFSFGHYAVTPRDGSLEFQLAKISG
jgi:hypothetical protein